MRLLLIFSFLIFISLKTYAIQIVGSEKLCQDLIILMGNNDDDLEVLYNDLISGQLVEEDRFKKMKEIEDVKIMTDERAKNFLSIDLDFVCPRHTCFF